MVGSDSNPIVTTVAPTIPVLAASNIPTIVTEIPNPPFIEPKSIDMVSRSPSAILDFSNITPIKTNRGTAINTSLFMMPNKRLGIASRKTESKWPVSAPMPANRRPVPARENATE